MTFTAYKQANHKKNLFGKISPPATPKSFDPLTHKRSVASLKNLATQKSTFGSVFLRTPFEVSKSLKQILPSFISEPKLKKIKTVKLQTTIDKNADVSTQTTQPPSITAIDTKFGNISKSEGLG